MTADFEVWLDAFLVSKAPADPFYSLQRMDTPEMGCYHPSNYQSRAMTVFHKNPHSPVGRESDPWTFEPNVSEAVSVYWKQSWVTLTDFYHESICLLFGRLESGTATKLKTVQHYINTRCHCSSGEKNQTLVADVHVTHHKEGHLCSMSVLSTRALAKVDRLTQ